MKFNVLRQHYGDRMYFPGDEREMAENEAAELVKSGVLKKAAAKPANKAEPAPKNKAK